MDIWAKWVEADGRFSFDLSDNGGTKISRKRHAELLAAEASGKAIAPDSEGVPTLSERQQPSPEFVIEQERAWRTAELSRYEWVVARHRDEVELGAATTITAEQYAELQAYRRALRDWPAADAFPTAEHRPPAPSWLPSLIQ